MKIIMSQEQLEKEGTTVFLAGPTPRSGEVDSWRPEMIEAFRRAGFKGTLIVPEFNSSNYEFVYDKQIMWEHDAMSISDVVLFWIPRKVNEGLPGFTTNIEFGMMISTTPSKLVVGGPIFADKNDYIKFLCKQENIKYNNTIVDMVSTVLSKEK